MGFSCSSESLTAFSFVSTAETEKDEIGRWGCGLGVIKEMGDFLRPLKKGKFGDLEDLLPGLNNELGRTTVPRFTELIVSFFLSSLSYVYALILLVALCYIYISREKDTGFLEMIRF